MTLIRKLKSLLGIGGPDDGGSSRDDVSVTVERAPEDDAEAADAADGGGGPTAPASASTSEQVGDAEPELDDAPVEDVSDAREEADPVEQPDDSAGQPSVDATGPSEGAAESEVVEDVPDPDEEDDAETDETDTSHEVGDADETESVGQPSGDQPEREASETVGTSGAGAGQPTVDETDSTEQPEESGVVEDVTDPDAESEPDVEADSDDDGEKEIETEDESDAEPVDEIKGIGASYANQLAGAGIDTIAELAAADAEDVAAQTELSEKRLSRWIDRARNR